MTKDDTHSSFAGIVVQSSGRRCKVKNEKGELIECTVRGKFRIKGLNTTNPVAIGDYVEVLRPQQGELATITDILPRKNYISRKAIAHATKIHILCANVDQVVLVFTIDHPMTSFGFADRFLLIAEAHDIPATFVINKIDLIESAAQKERLAQARQIYTNAGYEVLEINALGSESRASVEKLLKDKVSFIGGHSGVGKSTIINLVDDELDLKTSQISTYSNKGKHTTTQAEMFELQIGGYIIDSPGIKELGLTNFEAYEVGHFFPDFAPLLAECKFNTCIHLHEPGCAIKQAVEDNLLPKPRYQSYLSILEDIQSA